MHHSLVHLLSSHLRPTCQIEPAPGPCPLTVFNTSQAQTEVRETEQDDNDIAALADSSSERYCPNKRENFPTSKLLLAHSVARWSPRQAQQAPHTSPLSGARCHRRDWLRLSRNRHAQPRRAWGKKRGWWTRDAERPAPARAGEQQHKVCRRIWTASSSNPTIRA